jgi:hypothetical protein
MNADDLASSGVGLPEDGGFGSLEEYFAHLRRESARPLPRIDLSPTNPPELYNLGDDPREEKDLAERHPEVARRLEAELAAWFEHNRPGWERCRADDPYGLKY